MQKEESTLMRVYISNTDKVDHKPLYEQIVYLAKREGLQGATVLKGIMGFGGSSQISSSSLWEISEKLPVVVEIVDSSSSIIEFIEKLKPLLESSKKGYLVTTQKVDVSLFRKGEGR